MDLELSESELAFQAEAREWLAANVPAEPLPSMDTAEGWAKHQEWEAKLAEARWSVVSWPRDYHGREASLVEWVVFEEEYYRAGAPGRVSQNGIFLLAPIIFDHGTQEQQDRFLPTMATGEQIWAQCWSEPEAGSDLASLTSTARRDDERGGWVLNGQKTWSSRATFAHWGFGLFRSDPEAERHHGLTYFLFPLDAPGITVRPIAQLDGEAGFAEIFFEDVFVPDSDVLGDARRRLAGRDVDRRQRARAVAALPRPVLRRGGPAGRRCIARPPTCALADDVVDAWIKAQAYRFYTWGTVTRLANGGDMGAAGSVNKVFWSELDIALHETALDLLGPEAELESRWLDGYTFSLSGPIYAGTNEVQRNIVAERILGLPARGAPMRFELTEDQRDFAAALEGLLAGADTVKAARAWADGDHEPGLKLWARLAEQGVTMLATEATPVEVCVAFEALGRHAVPGPWVESAAYLPVALGREVEGIATVAVPPHVPLALDADVADEVYVGTTLVTDIGPHALLGRPDPAALRGQRGPGRRGTRPSTRRCWRSRRSCSAPASGCWPTASPTSKQRKQFGREIGSYQAIKHALADVRIALDFARPLVFAAALGEISPSAAKVAAGDAAYLAAADRAAGARRDRLHRRARPEPVADQDPGAGHRLGHAGRPPASGCSARGRSDGGRVLRGAAGAGRDGPLAAREARGLGRGPGGDDLRDGLRRGALADALRADRGGRAGDPGGVRRRRVLAARVDDRAGGGRPVAGALSPALVAGDRGGAAGRRDRRGEAAAAAADRGRRGGGVRRPG